MIKVGIEKLAVYPGALCLDLALLAKHRNYDPQHLSKNLMLRERSVNPLWEDAVTMAVNAANPLLNEFERSQIGLLIVATETGVDQEKRVSSWVHGFLGLPTNCRNFEIKSACYSGTAALQMAVSWILSGCSGGKKALIITADQSLIALNEPYEYVTGAGAVAILVSDTPRLLQIEPEKNGVYAHEVTDVIRPLPWVETGNSETSLFSYMEALNCAYDAYAANAKVTEFTKHFDFNVYHVPFAGIAFRAHKTLLQRETDFDKEQIFADFEKKTRPSIIYPQRIGGTYGGGVFVSLASLLTHAQHLNEGDRIGIFSYGSGSCAEFYSGLIGEDAQFLSRSRALDQLLDRRHSLDIEEYEHVERERNHALQQSSFKPDFKHFGRFFEDHYLGKNLLILHEVKNHYRRYDWS